MTTNRIEHLDSALLRPGRIDYKLYLGKACDYQKLELYRRFFPGATEVEAREFVEASCTTETMADFQGLLLAMERGESLLSIRRPSLQVHGITEKDHEKCLTT